MKNRPNFVPKSFKYEPSEYRQIGINWNAVFLSGSGRKFFIEIEGDWHYPEVGKRVDILIQAETCRMSLVPEPYNTVKAALNHMELLLDKFSA